MNDSPEGQESLEASKYALVSTGAWAGTRVFLVQRVDERHSDGRVTVFCYHCHWMEGGLKRTAPFTPEELQPTNS